MLVANEADAGCFNEQKQTADNRHSRETKDNHNNHNNNQTDRQTDSRIERCVEIPEEQKKLCQFPRSGVK